MHKNIYVTPCWITFSMYASLSSLPPFHSHKVCPGCGGWSEYVLTTPLFDSTTLTVQGDNLFSSHSSFTVSARKSSAADIYIQSAQLNGEDYNCAFLPHQVIVRGGSLVSCSPVPWWCNDVDIILTVELNCGCWYWTLTFSSFMYPRLFYSYYVLPLLLVFVMQGLWAGTHA